MVARDRYAGERQGARAEDRATELLVTATPVIVNVP
jgi:hypothetical protein